MENLDGDLFMAQVEIGEQGYKVVVAFQAFAEAFNKLNDVVNKHDDSLDTPLEIEKIAPQLGAIGMQAQIIAALLNWGSLSQAIEKYRDSIYTFDNREISTADNREISTAD